MSMDNEEFLQQSPEKAKEVLELTEALFVSIRRDSLQSSEKYLQRAKNLGLLRQVRLSD